MAFDEKMFLIALCFVESHVLCRLCPLSSCCFRARSNPSFSERSVVSVVTKTHCSQSLDEYLQSQNVGCCLSVEKSQTMRQQSYHYVISAVRRHQCTVNTPAKRSCHTVCWLNLLCAWEIPAIMTSYKIEVTLFLIFSAIIQPLFTAANSNVNNNNLLLGGSITKSGLHRGPNIRYILSQNIIKIQEYKAKSKYI